MLCGIHAWCDDYRRDGMLVAHLCKKDPWFNKSMINKEAQSIDLLLKYMLVWYGGGYGK